MAWGKKKRRNILVFDILPAFVIKKYETEGGNYEHYFLLKYWQDFLIISSKSKNCEINCL